MAAKKLRSAGTQAEVQVVWPGSCIPWWRVIIADTATKALQCRRSHMPRISTSSWVLGGPGTRRGS